MKEQVISDEQHFQWTEVTYGLYAAIAKEGGGAVANAGIVDLGDSVLVFDSFNTQQAAAQLRTGIEKIIGKPVAYLVNSHWHGDHIRGNQVFRDVDIVASEKTKALMEEKHPERIASQKSRIPELQGYIERLKAEQSATESEESRNSLGIQISFLQEIELSLSDLQLVLPTVTFDSEWSVQGEERLVKLISMGRGHTHSDAILYLPDVKVCYVGDLVAVENHMSIVDGDVHEWISILDRLEQWDIKWIVPGHGRVAGNEWIGLAKCYLQDVVRIADQFVASGRDLEAISEVAVPDAYAGWTASDLFTNNLRVLVEQKQFGEGNRL
ncbi:MBL fold metallo-hydrolase [Brevibacillus formosus]|uniref:MBL fold metallo-hydrolase n=1 Tax=Brevibacillus formosus TaxID=54913 RepID=UPI003F1CC096